MAELPPPWFTIGCMTHRERRETTAPFTLLMAVYGGNSLREVERSVQSSTIEQTLPPNQVVIVRDGPVQEPVQRYLDTLQSTMAVWFTAERPELEVPEVTIVPLDENRGLAHALNIGLQHCDFDVVARADCDIHKRCKTTIPGRGLPGSSVPFYCKGGPFFGNPARFPEKIVILTFQLREIRRFMSLNTKYDILDNRLVIRRLNAGDRQCFEACYRFYYKGLCSFASRWVSLPVAEDIVQDTMLYIWENRDRLMEELSLKGLLFMIVRNKSLDRISSQKVHSRVHQQLEKRFADQFDSPDFYLGTELARLYREALAQLPEQTRRIFEMSRFQGMTHQQIAAEMEVSPQTVNYHIGQALKVLGVALKDYLPLIALFFEMPGNN